MPDDRQLNDDLDAQMEHDTEIRRETEVRDALGPIEGTTAERNAAESALSPEERDGGSQNAAERGGSTQPQRPANEPAAAAHVERGPHSDLAVDFGTDVDEVRTTEGRE